MIEAKEGQEVVATPEPQPPKWWISWKRSGASLAMANAYLNHHRGARRGRRENRRAEEPAVRDFRCRPRDGILIQYPMGLAPVRSPAIDARYACFKYTIGDPDSSLWRLYAGSAFGSTRKVIEYTGERLNRRDAKYGDRGTYTYRAESITIGPSMKT